MLLSERNQRQRTKWALLETRSLVEAVHTARDMGWSEKKVQVRGVQVGISTEGPIVDYTIEPFEKDCNCPSILKYADYFIPEDDETLLSEVN